MKRLRSICRAFGIEGAGSVRFRKRKKRWLMMYNRKKLEEFEQKIGYEFRNKNLITLALTHSSFANERHQGNLANNERLEFLGDAVLELVSSEFLFLNNQKMHEGDLTKLRASLVCEPTLAACAREMDLGPYLLLGKGEDMTGGRERDSILSDAMEAIIGAIYLDSGFANAKEHILKFILSDIEHKKLFFDSKTILQEMIQGKSEETIQYQMLKEEGPDHNKKFTAAVCLGEKEMAQGTGRTKKASEQAAAYQAILKLKKENGE